MKQRGQCGTILFHPLFLSFLWSIFWFNSTSGHRRWYTEHRTPTVILKRRVPRTWPYSCPLWRNIVLLPSHTDSFDACTNKTWIRVYPEGMWRSDSSMVCMPREYYLLIFFFLFLLCSCLPPLNFNLFPSTILSRSSFSSCPTPLFHSPLSLF